MNAGEQVASLASQRGIAILIAPSVLYEGLRSKDESLRNRLVELMTRSCWTRVLPEAYHESFEFYSEVRRLRPEWARRRIPRRNVFLNDWKRKTGGFWDRARNDTANEARRLFQLDRGTVDAARAQANDLRATLRSAKWTFEAVDLSRISSRPSKRILGWKRDDLAAWRFSAWTSFNSAIENEEHPFLDWIGPCVDLTRAVRSGESWNRFWFYEIDSQRMSRFWMRWAVELLQGMRKVSDGAPCDTQLATYLVACDALVSADRVLVSIVERCRDRSPVPFASTALVRGGSNGVEDLMRYLVDRFDFKAGAGPSGGCGSMRTAS